MVHTLAERTEVDLARAGDKAAFDSLVRSRMDAMYRLSLAIVGNESDAADAVQESFIDVWRHLPNLRDGGKFDAWLQRIVVNSCRMALRSKSRRHVRELPMASLESVDRPAPQAGDIALLRAALGHLSADQRAMLALHHVDERPLSEIAAILSIPVGTAKSRLFTARTALGRALAEEEAR